MKKIIFFDIDGTLFVEGEYYIPESAIEAIHKAQANGHLCFVNTGRPISTIEQCIWDIGFDGFICGCGTYIHYDNMMIFKAELDENIRKEIIELSMDCHVENVLEGIDGDYFPENMQYPFFLHVYDRYKEQNFPVHKYNRDSLFNFEKMACYIREDSDKERFLNYFLEDKDYDIIDRGDNNYEIIPLGCTKATGIDVLLDYLGLSINDTISIGDSSNDLSMLTHTKESVAMGNGSPFLFDKVTYVTTSINEDGIYNALKHFNLF